MTNRHRHSLTLAVLITALLSTLVVPVVDARLPRATGYRVGGAITLDTNLRSTSGVPAWAFDEYLEAKTPLPRLGAAFVAAERKYRVNARFLLAAALHESGWGTSYISRVKHNLFGYNAFDRDPFRYANAYATYAANIDATAKFIRDFYLTPGGRWWGGQPTLRSMQQFWSSSGTWGVGVSRIATSIHLGSLARRGIRFSTPVVSGTLHGGSRVRIGLTWAGGAIPKSIRFLAHWEPIELDSVVGAVTFSSLVAGAPGDLVAGLAAPGTAPANESQAGRIRSSLVRRGPTIVRVRRVRTRSRSITFAVAAPSEPGRYLLRLEMRDSDRHPLPARERLRIPGVEVRVWGDRAVSYDVKPARGGAGAVIRITNTGRTTIPAAPGQIAPRPRDPETRAARTVVTVAASAGEPGSSAAVLLLTAPLRADLPPGASLSLNVPGIDALTGGATSWLSVNLSVLGDATWLAGYSTFGAWLSGPGPSTPGPTGTSIPAGTGPSGSPAAAVPTPIATPSPTVIPTATPRPSPTASPTPRPSPTASPTPTPWPTSTPTPWPTHPTRRPTEPVADRNAQAQANALTHAGSQTGHEELLGAQQCDPLPRELGKRAAPGLHRRQRRVVADPRLDRDVHLHRILGDVARPEGTDAGPRAGPARRACDRSRQPVAPVVRGARGALQALLPRLRAAHVDDQGAPDARPPIRRHRRDRRPVLTEDRPSRAVIEVRL